MVKVLEKVERRLGEKLFLKGDRCAGPKCAVIRRGYSPGVHGKSKRRRGLSEYAEFLREKQKVMFLYGLDDKDVRRYIKDAESKAGVFNSNFWSLLESRLDNMVFRLGFAPSRRAARQMVLHGHVMLNGRTMSIPSCRLKKGDTVSLKETAVASLSLGGLESRLKKLEVPVWFSLDKSKKSGKITDRPDTGILETDFNATKIKEFYSR